MKEQVLLSWSGGKDSMIALQEIITSQAYEIAALLTTVTEGYNRISMHGVRNELLERQAEMLELPLGKIWIPRSASNDEYQEKMHAELLKYKEKGAQSIVFGDLFLEDIKQYREELLSKIGMKAIFPIWKRDTTVLAKKFIHNGFKAVTVCIDSKILNKQFVGRIFDEHFLSDLPERIDPCGENGEFHTFVYDGPLFKRPVECLLGDIALRDSFYYCDLLLAAAQLTTI
jgi:uncharacterized protein (TIGR00290 family)